MGFFGGVCVGGGFLAWVGERALGVVLWALDGLWALGF